jgi:hypothetical protein
VGLLEGSLSEEVVIRLLKLFRKLTEAPLLYIGSSGDAIFIPNFFNTASIASRFKEPSLLIALRQRSFSSKG